MAGQTDQDILVVDLDGSLLATDMLHETFWNAYSTDWVVPLRAMVALLSGRPALKRMLAARSTVDVSTLPLNHQVMETIRDWRARGGRTALVTASDEHIAKSIADHLGVFDEVFGSDGKRNLKGAAKAAFLVDRYGEKSFAYLGDAAADMAVWRHAKKAITVQASRVLRGRVEGLDIPVQHLKRASTGVKPWIRVFRPHQWLKNLLIFVPLLTAHAFSGEMIVKSVLAFLAFSLIASGVYVHNDLSDLAADRAHPRKKERGFASGAVPISHGIWMILIPLGGGLALSANLGMTFLMVMLGYWLATTAYSLVLKRHLVIDICTLAGLYTSRILAGGVATGLTISVWLLAFSVFIFLSLAAIKRQAELVDAARRGALSASGRGYIIDDLPLVAQMAIASGYVAVLVLALYVNSPAVVKLYSQPEALWGICAIVLFWISRMVMVAHRGQMDDDPIVFTVKDRVSLSCGVLIAGFALVGTMF